MRFSIFGVTRFKKNIPLDAAVPKLKPELRWN